MMGRLSALGPSGASSIRRRHAVDGWVDDGIPSREMIAASCSNGEQGIAVGRSLSGVVIAVRSSPLHGCKVLSDVPRAVATAVATARIGHVIRSFA